ncbi:MAG: hypothetical protein M1458_01815 [Deltaproteobacteria bacterium]|nr:hypothetical protein [Deltaproteobacteria bacterium]
MKKVQWKRFFIFAVVIPIIFGVAVFSRLWMGNSTVTKAVSGRETGSKSLSLGSISNKVLKDFKAPVANACGLAPSSCVECHNGVMAEKSVGPIHHVHRPVSNITCTTCHAGNSFAIAKGMAHTNLVANPLTTPKFSCEACHASNLSQIVQKGISEEKAFYASNPNAPKIKG